MKKKLTSDKSGKITFVRQELLTRLPFFELVIFVILFPVLPLCVVSVPRSRSRSRRRLLRLSSKVLSPLWSNGVICWTKSIFYFTFSLQKKKKKTYIFWRSFIPNFLSLLFTISFTFSLSFSFLFTFPLSFPFSITFPFQFPLSFQFPFSFTFLLLFLNL